MAELFLARASALHGFEKLVVLKRILPQHAESEDFIRMFLAEARLAATLHHPNIVQVYDIGEDDGAHFFSMEYVQGQDLRKLVRAARKKEVPIPVEHVLHVAIGVAAGLNHAHEKIGLDGRALGIVHRDVSPSNVLVTYEGGVKIVDFGIAKAATAQVATIAGTLKGKIPYMSPEQCRGEPVDRRSDIFSIGTLLWELTTGTRLFSGDNEFAILNRVAKGDVPPPTSVRPDYPPELEAIVMRALQADPAQRYDTALDMQIDLEDFAREARLPVSSTRVAKFMRELFTDEIEKAAVELQTDRDDVTTMPQPVLTAPSMSPAAQTVAEVHELTPSEIRPGYGAPTPGPSASQTGTWDPGLVDTGVQPKHKPAVAIAVLAGVLGIGTISTLIYTAVSNMGAGDETEAAADEAGEVPAGLGITIDAVPPPPDPGDPVEDAPPGFADPPSEAVVQAPADDGEEIVEIEGEEPAAADGAPVDDVGAPSADDGAAVADPTPTATTPPPATPDDDPPPAAPKKPSKPKPAAKGDKNTKKSSSKKPTKPGKSSPSGPKWDPSSPLPPGMR